MKKIILYILVGLTATTCIYNTYKITTNNSNKVINKTIKEEFDSSSIDKKINDLTEENKKLTDEINALKEENTKLNNQLNDVIVKLNNKTNPKNYDSEINILKEENNTLKENYTSLINCLFNYKNDAMLVPNMAPGNGGNVYIRSIERCKPLMKIIPNSN